MSNTYIEYFNFYLKEYLNELIAYFPELKQPILENYRELLETKNSKNDTFVKYFMSRINDYLQQIAKRDETLFDREHLYLLEGVNFHKVWVSPDNKTKNKKGIWKYLQLLTLLGRQIIPNKNHILEMLKKVGTDMEEIERIDSTLNKEDTDVDETVAEGPLSNLMNTANMAQNLLGGDSGGIGEIFKGVGEMMKNIDIEELSKNMMSGLNNDEDDDDEDDKNNKGGNKNNSNSENVENNEDSSGTSQNNNNNNNNPNPSNLFNNGLFKDLAEEMSQTFDFEGMQQNVDTENPPNVGEVFQNFMSGDNPSKLMNLVGKFGNRLQKDIKKGNINQEQLLRQTQQMMGNMGGAMPNMEEMQKQMEEANLSKGQKNKINAHMRNQNARERLKAKYEKRQREEPNK